MWFVETSLCDSSRGQPRLNHRLRRSQDGEKVLYRDNFLVSPADKQRGGGRRYQRSLTVWIFRQCNAYSCVCVCACVRVCVCACVRVCENYLDMQKEIANTCECSLSLIELMSPGRRRRPNVDNS